MYWDTVLKEVLNRDSNNQEFLFTDCGRANKKRQATKIGPRQKPVMRRYYLDQNNQGVYFSRREAECMLHLMRGKTINGVANAIELSPRTVEFYIKNMKRKLKCRTKYELIDKVLNSRFLQAVDFT